MSQHRQAHHAALTGLTHTHTPPPRHLTKTAHLYATGRIAEAEASFTKTHQEILPLIRRVINQRTNTPTHREDIEQDAILKIWSILRKGIEPEIQRVTYHCVIDHHRKASGMGDTRSMTPEQAYAAGNHLTLETEHADRERDTDTTTPRHPTGHTDPAYAERVGIIDAGLIADTLSTHNPLWGVIALQLSEGQSQNQIARTLGVSRWIINKHVEAMREHLEESTT